MANQELSMGSRLVPKRGVGPRTSGTKYVISTMAFDELEIAHGIE